MINYKGLLHNSPFFCGHHLHFNSLIGVVDESGEIWYTYGTKCDFVLFRIINQQ